MNFMEDKPIIRHCLNCKWCDKAPISEGYCTVKYRFFDFGRLKALFCRFYKKKDNENGNS
jgi:hypothetical protein